MHENLPLLVVQMGLPPDAIRRAVGEQPAWFQAALAGHNLNIRVVRPFRDEPLPAPGTFRAAVISGSWSMVTEHEAWSERVAAWITTVVAAGVPLLGVCYGHQLMAYALGGRVDYHPQGSEVGQKTVMLNAAGENDPALYGLARAFPAFLSHSQSVLALPPGAVCLGASAHDAHQIIRYSPAALSVQFHPEFTAEIMNSIIDGRSGGEVRASGAHTTGDTPQARSILQRLALGQ